MLPYLVLLRVGFTMPRNVATRAVRSYRTISTLPVIPKDPSAVYFLLHFPSAHTAQTLSGTLPYGARTFLRIRRYSDCLTNSRRIRYGIFQDLQ